MIAPRHEPSTSQHPDFFTGHPFDSATAVPTHSLASMDQPINPRQPVTDETRYQEEADDGNQRLSLPQRWMHRVQDFVQAQPEIAIASAVILGAAIAWLVKRKEW